MNSVGHDIAAFMAENLREFRPIAYFDKDLDCIRVKLEDCQVVDVRLNRFLTVLSKRDDEGSSLNVGFTIKGVAHLFTKLGIELSGIVEVVDILNRILKIYPDSAVRRVIDEFAGEPRLDKLGVNFGDELQEA